VVSAGKADFTTQTQRTPRRHGGMSLFLVVPLQGPELDYSVSNTQASATPRLSARIVISALRTTQQRQYFPDIGLV